MQKLMATLALSAPLALGSLPAKASDLNVTIYNFTLEDLMLLHIVPSSAEKWGDSLLPIGVRAYDYTDVTLPNGRKLCHYHIRAEFSDWSVEKDYNVNLCETGEYRFDDGS